MSALSLSAWKPWKPKQTINIGGYSVDVYIYDILPIRPRSIIPVIICPGFLEVPKSWEKHADLLSVKGFRVIAYDAPHGLPLSHVGPSMGEYRIELQKMQTLVAVMQALKIDRADLIGRSEGAIWALLAAVYYPEKVRNIVLQNPAGLIGKDWFLPFLFRWCHDMRQTRRNEEGDPSPFSPIPANSVMARNWWRTIKEIWAIMYSDTYRSLQVACARHVKIGIISTDHDHLFPAELVRKQTEGLIDIFVKLHGSHTSFFCRTDEFANAIANMFDSLKQLDK